MLACMLGKTSQVTGLTVFWVACSLSKWLFNFQEREATALVARKIFPDRLSEIFLQISFFKFYTCINSISLDVFCFINVHNNSSSSPEGVFRWRGRLEKSHWPAPLSSKQPLGDRLGKLPDGIMDCLVQWPSWFFFLCHRWKEFILLVSKKKLVLFLVIFLLFQAL